MTLPERYWNFMLEMKAHSNYVVAYHAKVEKVDRMISGFLAFSSASSITGWVIWKDFSFVWAAIVASSQCLNVLRPYLPYRPRISPLRTLSYSFEELCLKTEARWHEIERGQLTEAEIDEILTGLKAEKSKRWKTIIGDLSLANDSKLAANADRQTEVYFKKHF